MSWIKRSRTLFLVDCLASKPDFTRRSLLSIFLILMVLGQSAALATPLSELRGPIEMADQSPHALLHSSLRPASALTLESGEILTRASLAWSNTFARREDYILDAETGSLNLELTAGLGDGIEVGLALPIIYRGGGSFDSVIDGWHDFFSLPQGDRDSVEDNQFALEAEYEDGAFYSNDSDGTELGDAELRAKFVWLSQEKRVLSFGTQLRLPTASQSSFGQDAVDLLLSMQGSFLVAKDWGIHSGLGYTWFGDTDSTFRFERNHISAFLFGEYLLQPSVSLLLGLLYESALIKEIDGFPDYALYVDTGVKISLNEKTTLDLLIRENPGGKRGTADITALIGLQRRWNN